MSDSLKIFAAAFAFFLVPLISQAQVAPSFDCAKASTRVEFMICDHPRIARLDSEMVDA